MKFRVTMKDPDGAYDSIKNEAERSAASLDAIDDAEREGIAETRAERMREFAGKWMAYGEYITVEFDTDAGTAVVVQEPK